MRKGWEEKGEGVGSRRSESRVGEEEERQHEEGIKNTKGEGRRTELEGGRAGENVGDVEGIDRVSMRVNVGKTLKLVHRRAEDDARVFETVVESEYTL